MAKKMKKLIALTLALAMCFSMMAIGVQAAGEDDAPEYVISLVPGKKTYAQREVSGLAGTTTYKLTAKSTDVETATKQTISEFTSPQSALKFDRNSTADQKAQKIATETYTDNGHFTDPSTVIVEGAPEGYPWKYVGNGDYSGHYVSHVRVVYERDEAGNAVLDENGDYVIKELQHVSSGTPLYYNDELSTNPEGPFHYATGTRPQQFLLMNEEGKTVYGYCIDLDTGAESGKWYAVANLEDNDYYATTDAENHVRGIVFNGYWGTESGTGSLSSLKAALKEALKAENPVFDVEQDVPMVNRKKFTTGYELQPGERHYGSYVYWNLPTEHVVLTEEIIDQMTEGEALDAMQAAIWSWANGSNGNLNGVDRAIVGDLYASSSQTSDSLNGKNDYEGAARTKALYQWLMQQTAAPSTIIVNDKTFADDIKLTLGKEVYGVRDASISFTIDGYDPATQDELVVALTYENAAGAMETIEKSLNGEDALAAVNGYYTIDGLKLKEGKAFDFTLNIYGKQQLQKNAYIYTSEGGTGASQTMVGMAEGTIQIDVSKSFQSDFVIEKSFVPHEDSGEMGSKKDELIDRKDNRYEVTIDVPGKDGDVRHDEVILMVDGSYSMDNEWPAMKEAINTIGETVLNGAGTTQLTLMAFGMGDNIVLEHVKDADALAASLGALPGNLLYGRSSTNCEAGFDGVANYIKNHDDTLKDVQVIFISDGNLNTDETLRAFDANWKTWSTAFGALTVAQVAFEETMLYGENLPAAFTTIFGDRFDGASRNDILTRGFGGEVTTEEFYAFAEQLWTDVYEYSGLTRGVAYPVSVAERAFVKYDKEMGTYIQDLFYYTTYKSSYVTYGDRWTRTPVAADRLAAMPEVKAMYVVDYDGYTSWMDTGITSEKSTFIQSNGIAGLCEALSGALGELAKTPFNDVVVTDYMSKWVNFIPGTEKIIDNTTGEVIWSRAEGWKITENRPTAQENPVVVELVDPSAYEAGGSDVVGNKSGEIYKLTWYVKDGAMLRSDNFRLAYEVTVDTKEENFKYDVIYPANGNTDLWYTDENGDRQKIEIDVPDVVAPDAELKIKKVDENGKTLSGAEFTLYKNDEAVGTYVVDQTGYVTITGLEYGSYKLVETKAPSGYLLLDEAVTFDVVVCKGIDDLEVDNVVNNNYTSFSNGVLTVKNQLPHSAVVLTIDMSGTMYRNKMDKVRYVDVAKGKARDFVEKYAATNVENAEAKRMLAIVCFDTDATVKQTWIDVSTAEGKTAALNAISKIKVADNGSASSNQVCTNFDGGVILTRNLLKQANVEGIARKFAIILSDGAPTVTVNADTDTVKTIKSSFWGNQLDASGKKYQNARAGGGWTHPAEVAQTLKYLATGDNNLADLTCTYKNADNEMKEGIFIVGVGGLMDEKLFYDAVYGTANGTRTTDVKKKPDAFNNVEALAGIDQADIMKMTTGGWMSTLAAKAGGTYESAKNAAALEAEFNSILAAISASTSSVSN